MKRTTLAMITALVASVAAIGTGAAIAHGKDGDKHGGKGRHHEKMVERMFERMDTDKDGSISKAEFDAAKKARFTRADANGDGKISLEEMTTEAQERAAKHAERHFAKLDKDGDGAVTAEEMEEARPGHGDMFAKLDKNEDGMISREEAEDGAKHMRGRHHRGKHQGAEMDDDHRLDD